MKNYINDKIKRLLLLSFLCLAGAGFLFVSCEKEEDNNSSDTELYSYGPMPIARGAELKFIGNNLDKVTSVILPENIEIPAESFTSTSATLITVTVPQEATEGLVILKSPEGEITTKTMLGFSEPISIDALTPASIKPGSELTITGDYLNLVGEVIFTDRIVVDSASFISQSRTELKLLVPATAQTGKIAVSNVGEDPIIVISEDELTVTLPTVTTVAPLTIKAGSELTIAGQDLDLVTLIVFSGDKKVTEFVSKTATEIVVLMPNDALDGKITLFPESGIAIEPDAELVLTAPTITSIAPNPIKNGAELTIVGTDLDLVSSVTFSGDVEGTITAKSETELKVTVPDAAVTGVVNISTLSEKSAESTELVLIDPTISGITPLTVMAGNDIVIAGTDLDLVTKVLFAEGLEVEVMAESETALTVTVPTAAVSGTITLLAINGTMIESAETLTIESANVPVINSITEQVKPGELVVIEGSKLNLVDVVIFQNDIKATSYGVRSETMIEVYVPNDAVTGTVTLTMVTFDLTEVTSPEFKVLGTDPITPETIMVIDYEEHGGHNGHWDNSWSGISEILVEDGNTFLRINADGGNDSWIINCNHQGDGAPAPVIENVENYVLKFDVRIEEGVTGAELAALQFLFADQWNYWYGTGLLPASTGGSWVTISVPVSTWDLSGTLDLSSGTNGLFGGPIPAGISFDNLRFDPK